jgi:flagellar hook-length control protein FliK
MPELLIATPPVVNLPTKSPAARSAEAPPTKAPEGIKNSAATREPTTSPPTAEAESSPPAANFAAVLKRQMAQGSKSPQGLPPPDLAALATPDKNSPSNGEVAALLNEIKSDAPTGLEIAELIPLIEQMMPQWLRKVAPLQGADGPSVPEESSIAAPEFISTVDPGSALIALPVTTATSPMPLQGTAGQSARAEMNASSTTPRATADATNTTLAAAITADEGTTDITSNSLSKNEGDFAALISKATEQLTGTSNATPVSAPAARLEGNNTTPIRIETPVSHANWSNELGNKLTWMATAQRQQADLVLNPPQLGRIEVSLTISGDQASAIFVSPNAEVRELLEGSLPRLREILSGAGIQLGQAQVGAESQSQFANQDPRGNGGASGNARILGNEDVPGALAAPPRSLTVGRGLVDTFA